MNPTTPRRTLRLTERVPAVCRLRSVDVDFLLAEHRAHLEIIPTRQVHEYRLTPLGHVGTIVAPTCRLLIRSKIPIDNILYLLDPAAAVSFSDRTTPLPSTELVDLLAARLAQLLSERAAAGLHRRYLERAEHGPFLHGRLDLPAQLREAAPRERLHCRYEEFTADVPWNQVPRAVAEMVLGSPFPGEGVKAALRQALHAFAEVSVVPLSVASFAGAEPDRLTEAYRPLLELSRLLFESLTPSETPGDVSCPAFLLDLERIWERYVTGGVLAGAAARDAYEVLVQPWLTVNAPVAGQPDIHLRPDIILKKDGGPVLVADAKWKRLRGTPLVTEDLYQVLAYCTALGVGRGVLVYPGRRNHIWKYTLSRSPVAIEVRTLRARGNRQKLQRSLQRFVAVLRS
jgi:5-methylcytosine-specific restriction enzyme subunit McrC